MRAAEQVFAKQGFSFTKISDIAAVAGLSHGLVYHYFDSKEALFAELIEEMFGEIAEELNQVADSACERLELALARSFQRTQGNPQSMQLMTQAMLIGGLPDPLRQCAFENAHDLVGKMSALVRECQDEGGITTDVDASQLTAVIASIMRGMSVRPPGDQAVSVPMPTLETLMKLMRPRAATDDPASPPTSTKSTNKKRTKAHVQKKA